MTAVFLAILYFTCVICGFQLSLSPIVTPRDLFSCTCSIAKPSISICTYVFNRHLPKKVETWSCSHLKIIYSSQTIISISRIHWCYFVINLNYHQSKTHLCKKYQIQQLWYLADIIYVQDKKFYVNHLYTFNTLTFFLFLFFFLFFRMWGIPSIIGFVCILLVYWLVCICCMHKTENNGKNPNNDRQRVWYLGSFPRSFCRERRRRVTLSNQRGGGFHWPCHTFSLISLPNIFAVWLSQTHLAVVFAYRTQHVHHFNNLLFTLGQILPKLQTQAKTCMSDILLFTLTSRGE